MVNFIAITWPLVGLLTAIIAIKIDKDKIAMTQLVSCMIFGYTLMFVIAWCELHERYIKKNPVILSFEK